MKLVFASQNQNKINEIQSKIQGIEIVGLDQYPIRGELEETGDTLKENARQKARFIHRLTHENCFADDTGLEVFALDGEPGVYSGRYAGEPKNDLNNLTLLLKKMQGQENRSARFVTYITLIWNGEEYLFEGICEGNILTQPQGRGGFGYDPIFQPIGYNKTFAEMTMEEKNTISHRGKAVQKLVEFLEDQIQKP